MPDRVAVVTGVSRGLGESLAAALIERGYVVVGLGRSAAPRLAGAGFRLIEADLRDTPALAIVADAVFGELAASRPDAIAVINNAASAGPASTIGALPPADAGEALDVNLLAPLVVADAFVRAFAGVPGDRRLVNVSSGAALRPVPGIGVYCIAKAGLEMLTRVVAAESDASGIVAVTIRPGIIDTPMQAFARSQPRERMPSVDMFRDFHASGQLVPPDVTAAKIVERLVVGEIGNGKAYDYAAL